MRWFWRTTFAGLIVLLFWFFCESISNAHVSVDGATNDPALSVSADRFQTQDRSLVLASNVGSSLTPSDAYGE